MLQLESSARLGVLVALCVLLLAGNAPAQTVSGSITGTLVDSTGAIVADGKVTVTNEATGAERSLTTTDTGVFIFTALPPTVYSVKVEKSGFRPLTRTGVTLTAGDRLALGNIELALGQTSEAITVTAETAALNTESADINAVLGTTQMNDLVIKGREFMNLVKLLPGVTQQGGADVSGGVYGIQAPAVGGIQALYNNMTLDGATGNDGGGPGFFSTGVAVDAIGEIKIVTNSYLPESGPNPGASIKLITKSGTKDFHGTVYYYKRHQEFNANDFFINRQGAQPFPYRLTTAGFTAGGPVYIPHVMNTNKNKLFFFWNSEITRSVLPAGQTFNSSPAPLQYTTPTALERQGDFSQSFDTNGKLIVIKDPTTGLPFRGNVIPPERINSNGQKLLSVFPLPNVTNTALTGGLYNYQFTNLQDAPKQSHTLKTDYLPTSKDTITLRLKKWISDTKSYTGVFSLNGTPLTFYDYYFTHDDGVLSWTHVLSPSIVNEFTGSFLGTKEDGLPREDRNYSKVQRQTYGITLGQLFPLSNPYGLLPNLSFNGISNPVSFATDNRAPIQTSEEHLELYDNLSYNKGSHAFKFGWYFYRIRTNEGQRANFFNGNISFNRDQSNPGDTNHPFANALLGNYQSYQEASARSLNNGVVQINEFYAQDQWKASKRLTITYGARFSAMGWYRLLAEQPGSMLVLSNYSPANSPLQYQPAIVNGVRVSLNPASGVVGPAYQIGAFVPGTGNPANGVVTNDDINAGKYPRGWVEPQPLQIEPRFGFALDVFGNGKTAIRGGFGEGKHVYSGGGVLFNEGENQPYVVTLQQFNGNLNTLLNTKGLVFPSTMSAFNRYQKVPTVLNWSFGVQQTLPGKIALDVSYVGNTARHIESIMDLNSLPAGARFAPQNIDPTTGAGVPDNLIRHYREYSYLQYLDNTGTSNYNSLQVQVNRRYAKALDIGVAYTWSKALGTDTGTSPRDGACNLPPGYAVNAGGSANCVINPFVSTQQWLGGLQAEDQTQVLVANYQWTLPNASKLVPNPVVKAVFDNWELSGIYTAASGFPTSVQVTSSVLGDISGSNILARPNCVAGVDPNSGSKTFAQWFNTAAFAMPAKGTFGTCGAMNFRGPGINNVDMTLMKRIPLGKTETRSLRIRVEAFNLLNHTQFNLINTAARFDGNGNQINSQFGQASSARQPRVLQLGATLYF